MHHLSLLPLSAVSVLETSTRKVQSRTDFLKTRLVILIQRENPSENIQQIKYVNDCSMCVYEVHSIIPMISWKLGHDGTHLCTVAVRGASGRNCRKGHQVIKEG